MFTEIRILSIIDTTLHKHTQTNGSESYHIFLEKEGLDGVNRNSLIMLRSALNRSRAHIERTLANALCFMLCEM